jgi:hypothetical protein
MDKVDGDRIRAGLEYIYWREAMNEAVASHDRIKLREAGCECYRVGVDFKDGKLTCRYCGTQALEAYPKVEKKEM